MVSPPSSVNYRGQGQGSEAFSASTHDRKCTDSKRAQKKGKYFKKSRKERQRMRLKQRHRARDDRRRWLRGLRTDLTFPACRATDGVPEVPTVAPIVDNDLRPAVRLQRGIDRSAGHCQQCVNRPKQSPCYLQVTHRRASLRLE